MSCLLADPTIINKDNGVQSSSRIATEGIVTDSSAGASTITSPPGMAQISRARGYVWIDGPLIGFSSRGHLLTDSLSITSDSVTESVFLGVKIIGNWDCIEC
ncbi:hypothetical protein HNY73_013203 [Argiope bruennichi]|uniref:Uncharacterized protein n=1 Tax=Argiope bruennichi TaxID=94029 RepID=A0A8T0EY07_ARGBR|nr:hypothetical protein HNY73_013203 [Argiope bruennichi]